MWNADASQPPVAWMFDATIVVTPASSVADELSAVNEIDACPPGSSVSAGNVPCSVNESPFESAAVPVPLPEPAEVQYEYAAVAPGRGRRQPRLQRASSSK